MQGMQHLVSQAKLTHVLAGQFNALFLPRFLDCFDYRICHYDRSADPRLDEYDEHCVITFWHEYIVSILPRWGHTPVTALCSLHRDGEWVNQTALSLGLNVVRGSSSRGGAHALRQLKNSLQFSSLAITPDGPRGPRRKMAPGAIYLAAKLQVPLVPMGVGISRAHRLNTWDRFAIPKPGSRIRVIIGPKIRLPKRFKRVDLDRFQRDYEQLQNDLCAAADQWAVSGAEMEGEMRCKQRRRATRLVFPKPQTKCFGKGDCMIRDSSDETRSFPQLESFKGSKPRLSVIQEAISDEIRRA